MKLLRGSRFILCRSFEHLHTISHCHACVYILDDLESGVDAGG